MINNQHPHHCGTSVCLSLSRETEDHDLNIQCDAFEDSLTEDEEEMEKLYGGIDMSSHQQVFTSLLTKVASTQRRVHLHDYSDKCF